MRYFTVVDEHGHFGRAAEALRVAQPSLSRRIRLLEQELGTRLLDRTPRGTRLTEAREVFLPRARALLRSAAEATARTRAAARAEQVHGRLHHDPHCHPGLRAPNRMGARSARGVWHACSPGRPFCSELLRALRRRRPDAEMHAVHLPWDEAPSALLDHRVDAVVTRLPLATDGLEVTVLHDEPRVLMVPLDRRLAGKESVTLDDIADEPTPRVRDNPVRDAYWRIDPRPDGRPAPDGPLVEAMEDKYELIADGQAVAIVPATPRVHTVRPDLTTPPWTASIRAMWCWRRAPGIAAGRWRSSAGAPGRRSGVRPSRRR